MLIRSGKIQFLFWTAFFAVFLYVWLVAIGFQTFVLPDEKLMEIPQNSVVLMFILYGFMVIAILAGTIVSIMINNRFYTRLFGSFIIVALVTFLLAKGMFG
ncbi:hypothetical protein [Sulfurovum sp.]|uniref:hypothetical protein n=1 Tax=Sulfurovum sp. TaxID=1969726 RepID=UPI0025FF284B|nr:hypothetical protein [Sulfurovum sp.]